MDYAVIEAGKIVNKIVLDNSASPWDFSPLKLVKNSTHHIGDFYDGVKFTSAVAPPTKTEILNTQKESSKIEIAAVVDGTRSRYVRNPDQQKIYDIKVSEALLYKKAGYPTIFSKLDYPILDGQFYITKQPMKDLVDSILATKAAWVNIAGKIEGLRIQANTNIDNSMSLTDVNKIKDAAILALNLL